MTSVASVRAPARLNAVTMSTRWPAHVKRTPFTGAEGTVGAVMRRLVAVFAVLVGAWVAFSLVVFEAAPWAGTAPKHADAVVVLSGGRERLPPAMKLIREGVAPVLAISSVDRTKPWRLGNELCDAGRYAGARVLCFEMESATIFTLGRIFGLKTGAVFAAVANRATNDFGLEAGVDDSIEVAVEAVKRLKSHSV